MEFLGQRWDYREDKFHEIGTSDQSLMTDGKYRSIDMAVRHHFKQWADGKSFAFWCGRATTRSTSNTSGHTT